MAEGRITLRPHSPQDLLALIESVEAYERQTGARTAPGLRDFLVSADVSPAWLDRLRSAGKADAWEHGFAVVDERTRMTIGTAAFKGPPDGDGVTEIAYGIVPAYQNRGYATEAAAALIAFAIRSGRVRRLRAHTFAEVNASTRVLEKNGFVKVSEVVDPEDGPVWRWERDA